MLAQIKGKKLLLAIRLHEPKVSKSKKTLVVASTRGAKKSTVQIDGKPVFVNANAYIFPDNPTPIASAASKTRQKAQSATRKSRLTKGGAA